MKRAITLSLSLSFICAQAFSLDHNVHGLVDLRYTTTDGIDSYLDGDYGKFRYEDGDQFSLAQGAIAYRMSWQEQFNLHVIANGYADGIKDAIGISEAYGQYRSLPSSNGYRFKFKGGFIYPRVSMTNFLAGWSSPYTLTYSTLNTWLAEELRHQGIEFNVTKLGKFSGSDHDFSFSLAFYKDNDPAGAVLSWHGWTMSSRQTLRQENLELPNSHIRFVPDNSNIFLELDHRYGFHATAQWTWHGHGRVLFGYYDNNTDPKVVENTQWAWTTTFYHLGIKWRLCEGLDLIAQSMYGDTLMETPSGSMDLVNNDYYSNYIMLSKNIDRHRFTGRIEQFSVKDNDDISFDNNEEDGNAATLNYTFKMNKHLFLHTEFNWIDSDRPSRVEKGHSEDLIERQLQFGLRYFL